jgi:hypothetical protein
LAQFPKEKEPVRGERSSSGKAVTFQPVQTGIQILGFSQKFDRVMLSEIYEDNVDGY